MQKVAGSSPYRLREAATPARQVHGTLRIELARGEPRSRPPIGPDRGRRYGWQYVRISTGTRSRTLRLRLSEAAWRAVIRDGRAQAKLTAGGRYRVQLVR